MLADAPLKMAISAGCVTAQAIARTGISDVGHGLGVHVETPSAMTGLTIRMIGSHVLVAGYVLVADATLLLPDDLRCGDRRSFARASGLPDDRRAGHDQEEPDGYTDCGEAASFGFIRSNHALRSSLREFRLFGLCVPQSAP